MRYFIPAIILLLAALLAGACGFSCAVRHACRRLMDQTALLAADDATRSCANCTLMLRANGVELSDQPGPGRASLRIFSERMRREALTIAGQARVREYVLIFEVDFSSCRSGRRES
jgi:LPS-assembly lipoprotein